MVTVSAVSPSRTSRRILVVEDDAVLGNLITAVLEDAGYESVLAISPDEARGTYDLVVTDYLAPIYEPGKPWPHVERLRDLCQGPILGCTGHQDALLDSPDRLGITAVAAKPFDVDELLQTVERLLDEGTRLAEASPMGRAPTSGA